MSVPIKLPSQDKFRWSLFIFVVVCHLGAISAFWFFTWTALMGFVIGSIASGLFGIVLGYHRLLAHGTYTSGPLTRRGLALLGALASQSGPITWVAVHRFHHRHPDEDGDPHSPETGLFWAHFGWVFWTPHEYYDQVRFMAKDLAEDPFLVFLEKWIYVINGVSALAIAAIGWWVGGVYFAISLVTWLFFMRIVYLWHITFIVNSAGHAIGYRRYATKDNSRNSVLISLISFGEGYHNNHHAAPGSALLGHKWYEPDIGYLAIRILRALGLVDQVYTPLPGIKEQKPLEK